MARIRVILLILIVSVMSIYKVKGHLFSFHYKLNIPSTIGKQEHQFAAKDSFMFANRSGIIQVMNINNEHSEYYNLIRSEGLAVSKSTHYFICFNDSQLLRVNYLTGHYKYLYRDSLNTSDSIIDADISENGKIFVLFGSGKLAVYDGNIWTMNQLKFGHLSIQGIKIINDTSAIIHASDYMFFLFDYNNFSIYKSFYPYPPGFEFSDWDVSGKGVLWVAGKNKIYMYKPGELKTFEKSEFENQRGDFDIIRVGKNDKVIVKDGRAYYSYDGINWKVLFYTSANYYKERLAISNKNRAFYLRFSRFDCIILDDNLKNAYSFYFSADNEIKHLEIYSKESFNIPYFASDSIVFFFELYRSYSESWENPLKIFHVPDLITCLTPGENLLLPAVGTMHGVYNIPGFNNDLLPAQSINALTYADSIYYIGTDSGLVEYSLGNYTLYNKANSPLPSNKITFLDKYRENTILIGTDNGMAILENSKWSVYDISNVPVSSFWVNHIFLDPFHNNYTFVSTSGSGLIRIEGNDIKVYNTANSTLPEDTVYHYIELELGECGFYYLAALKHGIALYGFNDTFRMDTPLISKLGVSGYGYYILEIDNKLYEYMPCPGISEISNNTQLNWYQNKDELIISLPDNFIGKTNILLADISGKTVRNNSYTPMNGKINLDVSGLSTGIYLVQARCNNRVGYCKVLLVR